jgi:hypothetical protein
MSKNVLEGIKQMQGNKEDGKPNFAIKEWVIINPSEPCRRCRLTALQSLGGNS